MALERTNISEEHITSIIRVKRIKELRHHIPEDSILYVL
jgi:hypothetical protein